MSIKNCKPINKQIILCEIIEFISQKKNYSIDLSVCRTEMHTFSLNYDEYDVPKASNFEEEEDYLLTFTYFSFPFFTYIFIPLLNTRVNMRMQRRYTLR